MDSDDYERLDRDAKRKRLRKGTHSCWECKRRKVRCTFVSASDATCITCRRRGTKCIGQELPEEICQTEDGAGSMVRVEALLNQLVKTIDHRAVKDGVPSTSSERQGHDLVALNLASEPEPMLLMSSHEPSPVGLTTRGPSSVNEFAQERIPQVAKDMSAYPSMSSFRTLESQASPSEKPTPSDPGKYEKISLALIAAFPSQKDIDILLQTCNEPTQFCHKVSDMLYSQKHYGQLGDEAKLAKISGPNTHPVLLAKQMLVFSSFLMDLSPQQRIYGLAENHRATMERLADTAIRLVTTNEELFGTVESLECILLEALYHLNYGNIRRAWLAFRRAMSSAQLIGICHPRCPPTKKLDPDTIIDPQFMWSHIVYMDRFLSLMLALPPSHADMKLESEIALAKGAPVDRLERIHATVSAKILERNQLSPSQRVIALTLNIDKDLRMAAEDLPASFWRPPDFTAIKKDSDEAFKETMRIRHHVAHYTLLNQLHLPYLLCPNIDKNEYSRSSCVYASREILARFVIFRTFYSISTCCRLADFLALVAGMTLILAHLSSYHHNETDNVLTHQRLGDRATVEQALEIMKMTFKLNEDMLDAKCASVLQRLLHIEAAATEAKSVNMNKAHGVESNRGDECQALFVTCPYFGTIRIAHDGIKSVDTLTISSQNTYDLEAGITIGGIGTIYVVDHMMFNDNAQSSTDNSIGLGDCGDYSPQPEGMLATTTSGKAQNTHTIAAEDFMIQQDSGLGTAAGMNDWLFPGVEANFFDSLMMQADVQAGDGSSATDWARTVPGELGRS